jgi:uncharacterized protein YggE
MYAACEACRAGRGSIVEVELFMRLALAALLSFATATASAQPVPPPAPSAVRAYEPAPWWMDKPIIASVGYVTAETPANRANLSATYDAVDRDSVEATRIAIQKAKAVTGALTAFGPDKVRVATSINITPLYEQYRDRQGTKVENERADKIDRYQVSVAFAVEVRDLRVVEPVYAILVSAKPSHTDAVSFSLEPSDATRTQMFKLAVEDARRRAELAATAAGAKIGAVRIIDPTARACEVDVLVTGAGRSYGNTPAYPVAAPAPPRPSESVEEIVVSAQRKAQAAGLKPEDVQLPVQTPMERLEGRACVVFSLG